MQGEMITFHAEKKSEIISFYDFEPSHELITCESPYHFLSLLECNPNSLEDPTMLIPNSEQRLANYSSTASHVILIYCLSFGVSVYQLNCKKHKTKYSERLEQFYERTLSWWETFIDWSWGWIMFPAEMMMKNCCEMGTGLSMPVRGRQDTACSHQFLIRTSGFWRIMSSVSWLPSLTLDTLLLKVKSADGSFLSHELWVHEPCSLCKTSEWSWWSWLLFLDMQRLNPLCFQKLFWNPFIAVCFVAEKSPWEQCLKLLVPCNYCEDRNSQEWWRMKCMISQNEAHHRDHSSKLGWYDNDLLFFFRHWSHILALFPDSHSLQLFLVLLFTDEVMQRYLTMKKWVSCCDSSAPDTHYLSMMILLISV